MTANKKKVAVVTGAGSGIGEALGLTLAGRAVVVFAHVNAGRIKNFTESLMKS